MLIYLVILNLIQSTVCYLIGWYSCSKNRAVEWGPWIAPKDIEIVGAQMGGRTSDKTGGKVHVMLNNGKSVLVAKGSRER